ncbi:MAG: hypothetical protein ACI89J_002495 [Hyphomicrobiaceae bacterium]|jgi:hypothetical protein
MSLYEGFFGAKRKSGATGNGPEHFRVRPFAEHIMGQSQSVSVGAADVFAPNVVAPNGHASNGHASSVPNGHAQSVYVPTEHAHQSWVDTIASTSGNSIASAGHPVAASMISAPIPAPASNAGQELQSTYFPSVPAQQSTQNGVASGAWNDSYDRSLGNIQDHVHAVAGAVAMLDAVEHKMIAIKCELQRIREAGLAIDSDKVLMALQSLSDYVNQAISSVDDQCVNMLRDAKLEIRFAELETQGEHPDGVKLTMISIERLLDYKIKSALTEGLVAEETPEFVDDICSIISSNIQVLTSVMLALFASRDYTQAVTKLAARESIIPSITDQPVQQIASATIDRLQFDSLDQRDGQGDQLHEGRASLAELLKNVRENRNGAGAPFN